MGIIVFLVFLKLALSFEQEVTPINLDARSRFGVFFPNRPQTPLDFSLLLRLIFQKPTIPTHLSPFNK